MTARNNKIVHSNKKIVSGTPVFQGTRVPLQNMFDYLVHGENLRDFHFGFPSVHPDLAVAALKAAKEAMDQAALRSPDGLFLSESSVMGGSPVSVGTREELNSLFDYLIQTGTVKDFHYDYPEVAPWQSEAALRMAQKILEQEAYAAAA